MGCSPSSSIANFNIERHADETTVFFPLSSYQKNLLWRTWKYLDENRLLFGSGVFYRLLTKYPFMQKLFPEFDNMKDVADLKVWPALEGHPRKIVFAYDEAINAMDDCDLFISKMTLLGEKHTERIKSEYFENMGDAIIITIESIIPSEEWNEEVKSAWIEFFRFITKLLKEGIEKGQRAMAEQKRAMEEEQSII